MDGSILAACNANKKQSVTTADHDIVLLRDRKFSCSRLECTSYRLNVGQNIYNDVGKYTTVNYQVSYNYNAVFSRLYLIEGAVRNNCKCSWLDRVHLAEFLFFSVVGATCTQTATSQAMSIAIHPGPD